jgi:hypothetical protein
MQWFFAIGCSRSEIFECLSAPESEGLKMLDKAGKIMAWWLRRYLNVFGEGVTMSTCDG